MSYEELVESRKNIGDMTKEELFEYCNGLLNEVWNFEKEIERLNNIIKRLEKWLINEIKFQEIVERDYGFRKSYHKLQELKGVDKE